MLMVCTKKKSITVYYQETPPNVKQEWHNRGIKKGTADERAHQMDEEYAEIEWQFCRPNTR